MTREEAIDILRQPDRIGCNLIKANDEESTKYNQESIEALTMAIKALKQEPKIGHWTHDGSHWKNRFICSECNYKLFDEPTNYCPNCGAKMAESEEIDI